MEYRYLLLLSAICEIYFSDGYNQICFQRSFVSISKLSLENKSLQPNTYAVVRFNSNDENDAELSNGTEEVLADEESMTLTKELIEELKARRVLTEMQEDEILEQELTGEMKNRHITAVKTSIVPNSEMTPTEVISTLLEALRNNDEPYPNHGMEVFYRFASPRSLWYDYDIEKVSAYMMSSKYAVLTQWHAINYPREMDISADGSRAYQVLRLRNKLKNRWEVVSFSLSMCEQCWMVDSVIVKSK